MICSAIAFAGQTGPQKYQSATVLDAKEHQGPIPDNAGDASITRYDITIRVKDTEYVVLYTPRPGTHGFQYMNGTTMLVLVKDNTVTFNDILGRSMTAPILSQRPAAPRNKP
jgi:hypothetical protein